MTNEELQTLVADAVYNFADRKECRDNNIGCVMITFQAGPTDNTELGSVVNCSHGTVGESKKLQLLRVISILNKTTEDLIKLLSE